MIGPSGVKRDNHDIAKRASASVDGSLDTSAATSRSISPVSRFPATTSELSTRRRRKLTFVTIPKITVSSSA